MTVTTDVKKTGNTVTGKFTLKNLPSFDADATKQAAKKPLLAYVGAADLAIERAKEIPAELTVATTNVTKKAQALLAEVPGQVTAQVQGLPVTVRTSVEKATGKATDFYAKLTVRGERLVKAIRRQPATEAAIAEGKEAVRKAEAAATAARKSVKAGEKAVEDAAAKIG